MSFVRSFVHSFTHSLTHSLIHSFIHPFIYSFTHSFSQSFIHSFYSQRSSLRLSKIVPSFMLSSKMLSSILTFAPRSSLRYGRHGWYCTFLATWFRLSGAGMRRDQILPVQPPNLKKRAFPAKTIVCSRFQAFLAERSHSPPLAAIRSHSQVATSGRSS